MSSRKNRPSPAESATLFPVGEIKPGNDDDLWIVFQTSQGVKRWKKAVPGKDITVKIGRFGAPTGILTVKSGVCPPGLMVLGKIKSFKELGQFTVKGNLSYGDFAASTRVRFRDKLLKKGKYTLYSINGETLLAVNNGCPVCKLKQIKWLYITQVRVDSGEFGFYDTDYVEKFNRFDLKSRKKTLGTGRKRYQKLHSIPPIKFNRKPRMLDETSFLKYEAEQLPKELQRVWGVRSPTGVGDGSFPVYSSGRNAALIVGWQTQMLQI